MYNTTTIPTILIEKEPTTLFCSLMYGFVLAMPFWLSILRMLRKNSYEGSESLEGAADDEEEEEEDLSSEEPAEPLYSAELQLLNDRELSETDLAELQTKCVCERVESSNETIKQFDIIMTYNNESESFCYYTDHLKEVNYGILETVARKFVIEHNCKRLYAQKGDGLERLVKETASAQIGSSSGSSGSSGSGGDPPAENVVNEKKSVFAKFKKYNKGMSANTPQIVEQTNHFRYKGKHYQYEESLKQTEKEKNTNPVLDYAAYKLLMQAKKEQ